MEPCRLLRQRSLGQEVEPDFDDGLEQPRTKIYDLGGRLFTATDELVHTTTYTYDAQNNVLTQKDNLNNTTTHTYDAKGNLKTITDANSPPGVTQYSYDASDRLTSATDALGHKTTYSYDANGNLTTVTGANRQTVGNPESGTAQCGAKLTGNNVDDDSDGFIDDGCPSTIYTYDALNRLQSTTDALAHVTTYTYDAASNLRTMTDPRGIVLTYTPDVLNRMHIMASSTGERVTYDYDAAGNRHDMADVNGDVSGTTTYTYGDGLNRLTQLDVTYPAAKTIKYSYDAVGNISRLTYPDTTSYVTYGYNADHTMSSAQQSWGSVGATAYTYNNAGNPTNATLPNGAWTDFGHDNADRLTSVANKQPGPTAMSSYNYTLDSVGNRTQVSGTNPTQAYQYDALYRLRQAAYSGGPTDTYTYDADGNRLTKNTTSYTYNAADELTQAGSVAYGYGSDGNNGNLATRGSDSFTFNYANQLTQTVIGGVTSASLYNGDGLRMKHTVDVTGTPVTANYVWDVNRSVPQILQDGTNTYVYGLGLISSTDGSGNQTYYTGDGLGSTADLTNSSATKTDGYSYDAFGTPTHSPGSSTQPFQFTGQQKDADSGLQYLRARYYDASTGRFLSQDPIAGLAQVPQTQNRYQYALNNPTTFDDPTGQFCHSVNGCFKSVAGAVSDVAVAVAPYAAQCAIWGGGAALATLGNPTAAAAGCATGVGAELWTNYVSNDVFSQCAIWALGGAVQGGLANVNPAATGGLGCVAGASSWLNGHSGSGDASNECTIWGGVGIVASTLEEPVLALHLGAAAGGGCLAGIGSNVAHHFFTNRQKE
ncbi:MAG TPA: RHS repeat-associated core domain-containing protein [Dehalococcoidia bacterium]